MSDATVIWIQEKKERHKALLTISKHLEEGYKIDTSLREAIPCSYCQRLVRATELGGCPNCGAPLEQKTE